MPTACKTSDASAPGSFTSFNSRPVHGIRGKRQWKTSLRYASFRFSLPSFLHSIPFCFSLPQLLTKSLFNKKSVLGSHSINIREILIGVRLKNSDVSTLITQAYKKHLLLTTAYRFLTSFFKKTFSKRQRRMLAQRDGFKRLPSNRTNIQNQYFDLWHGDKLWK